MSFLDRADEPIAFPRDGTDQALLLTGIAQRLPHSVDVARQGGFRYDPATPDDIDQVVLSHDMLAVLHQVKERVEHLRSGVDGLGSAHELATIGIEHKIFKLVWHVFLRDRPHCALSCSREVYLA